MYILHQYRTSKIIELLNNNLNFMFLYVCLNRAMDFMPRREVVFDDKGGLTTRGPLAYRIPRCTDIPGQLNVGLLKDSPNPKAAIYSSKVVTNICHT